MRVLIIALYLFGFGNLYAQSTYDVLEEVNLKLERPLIANDALDISSLFQAGTDLSVLAGEQLEVKLILKFESKTDLDALQKITVVFGEGGLDVPLVSGTYDLFGISNPNWKIHIEENFLYLCITHLPPGSDYLYTVQVEDLNNVWSPVYSYPN